MGEPRFCMDKLPELPANARKRMGVLTGKLWGNPQLRASPLPGQAPYRLLVAFLDGSPALQRRVAGVAAEWMKHAHVELVFGARPELAQIRISFTHEPGVSWSHVGTDCLDVPKDEPTMNLGWLKAGSPEEELRRVVLHEFGHALGCIHEHSQPGATIPWNEAKVLAFYAKRGWSREDTRMNVLDRIAPAQSLHSRFDRKSIMLYPIPGELTDGKLSVGWNTQLSAKDKAFIGRAYPRPAERRSRSA